MNHNNIQRASTAAVVIAAAATLGACEQPRWNDPNYISQQLEQGDPNVRKVALGHLDKLEDEDKKKVVPSLTKVYLEKGPNQEEIINVLVMLRDPAAKDAYIEEVKTDAGGKAGPAAEALGEAGAPEAIPAMIKLLEETDDPDVKLGILRGFSHMPDAQMVGPLVEILKLDADNNPIGMHAYACEILGEIAQDKPESLDDGARQTLVRSIFTSNNKKQNVANECGMAVQQLGAPAIPYLVKIYEGQDEAIRKKMMAYELAPNYPEGVAAVRLTVLQARQEAPPLFVADITEKKELPKSAQGSRDSAIAWLSAEGQKVSEEILALGDLKHAEARDTLVEAMTGEYDDEWEELKNAAGLLLLVQLRQNAAASLNRLDDRSVAPRLLEAAQDFESFKALVDNALAVAKHNKTDPPAPATLYSYNVTLAQNYTYLADASGKEAYVEWVEGVEPEGLVAELKKNLPAFDAHAECGAKGDPKAQAKCWGEKIGAEQPVVRHKAVYELARLPSEAAAPVLAANVSTEKLGTRELVSAALYHHPSQAALNNVDEVLKNEGERSGQGHKLSRRRLKLLRAWLANNT